MGSSVLSEAISSIRAWSMTEGKEPTRGVRATEAFGSLVFNDEVQQTRLPKPVYHALRRTLTHGEALDVSVADAVASAMKEWAVEPKRRRTRTACLEIASIERSSGVFLSSASPVQLTNAVGMTSVVELPLFNSHGGLVGSHAV